MRDNRTVFRSAALATAIAAIGAAALSSGVAAADAQGPSPLARRHDPAPERTVDHDLKGPFSERQAAERKEALQQVISGDAKTTERNGSKVVKLGKSKYVELARQKTDKIFTVLVDFGDKVDDTTMFDPDGDGPKPPVKKYGGDPGPAHNKIAEPDRAEDNSTAWQKDFNQKHFQDLYFSHDKKKQSLAKYYEKQSSGRYSVQGEVSDWVKVDYNEARYGSNYCGQTNCASAWDLIRDGVNQWAKDQKAKGRTDAQIKTDLAKYDQWDRYDHDGDGNFNEPDGYIDHFQIVHMRRGRVRGRRRPEDQRHLGAPLVRLRHRQPAGPAPVRTRRAAPRSATPGSGSATTPCSRRTADSASSPTSTAMTWACRTSTTPAAPASPPWTSGR